MNKTIASSKFVSRPIGRAPDRSRYASGTKMAIRINAPTNFQHHELRDLQVERFDQIVERSESCLDFDDRLASTPATAECRSCRRVCRLNIRGTWK